jgi:hypothetical protein
VESEPCVSLTFGAERRQNGHLDPTVLEDIRLNLGTFLQDYRIHSQRYSQHKEQEKQFSFA